MKKLIMYLSVLGIFNFYGMTSAVSAQEQTSTETAGNVSAGESAGTTTDWKSEIESDKGQIKTQLDSMKEAGTTAREEEKTLVGQIQEAAKSGDTETAKSLKEQLKTTRQENIKERNAAVEQLNGYQKELRSDVGGARKDAGLPPAQRPPAKGDAGNPPGFNPRGAGPGNPPGFNPPDNRRLPPPSADKKEGVVDRREDIRDRREDAWDATHNPPPGTEAYRRDKLEDVRDRREDVRDRREDVRDHRENVQDRRENFRDRKENSGDRAQAHQDRGVRDHGAGIGAGRGQGGEHRADVSAPKGNRFAPGGGGEHRGGGQGGGRGGGRGGRR